MSPPADEGTASLRPDDPRAPYLQMANDIRDEIRSGLLGPGDRLPSTRELMERYDVANMTVQGAMRVLRAENLIYSVPGRGTFVRSDLTPEDLDQGDQGHSEDYLALRRQVHALAREVRSIHERLDQVEGAVGDRLPDRPDGQA